MKDKTNLELFNHILEGFMAICLLIFRFIIFIINKCMDFTKYIIKLIDNKKTKK